MDPEFRSNFDSDLPEWLCLGSRLNDCLRPECRMTLPRRYHVIGRCGSRPSRFMFYSSNGWVLRLSRCTRLKSVSEFGTSRRQSVLATLLPCKKYRNLVWSGSLPWASAKPSCIGRSEKGWTKWSSVKRRATLWILARSASGIKKQLSTMKVNTRKKKSRSTLRPWNAKFTPSLWKYTHKLANATPLSPPYRSGTTIPG